MNDVLPALQQKLHDHSRPTGDGHLIWTGTRATKANGHTPVIVHRGTTYTVRRIAFRIHHGRDPQGTVRTNCTQPSCVAPGHVDDTATRQRHRLALRYITGLGERPATCLNGHDQGIYGRLDSNGHAYCAACLRDKKRKSRMKTPALAHDTAA